VEILAAESTELFIGTEERPRQVVRVRLLETSTGGRSAKVAVRGDRLAAPEPVALEALAPGQQTSVEVGIEVDDGLEPGSTLAAEVIVEGAAGETRRPLVVTVAEPGWRVFMVSHFHYDPVWWNTQAAYTEAWGAARQTRALFQEPGLALVKAHLEIARRDADYKFVLAELDYLKPYWDSYPEDRAYLRQLMSEGRLELMGGTYNEPNTNLTSAESTIRNAIYGVGYQRDVLGGDPQTAWQLDAFGHDPQFPGIMADAGISSSSWARGPFHEWGPHWVRGPGAVQPMWMRVDDPPGMQFESEFEWISPSGRGVLTAFMADHYSSGWWMDAATSLERAEAEVYGLFRDLKGEAATRNVLLPVGTDYSPPNKWVTAIHRDWNARYVWPKFLTAIPREFFDAVREARAATGRSFSPQTRDMNPVYTGKDVSFIDTKQAQRVAENTLMSAEKFATVASLLGARYPTEATDKAWRQLLFGAHHDGITGSESDQVYLDLLGGWREAQELAGGVLDRALEHLGSQIETAGEGQAITVFNSLSWPRSDIVRVEVAVADPGIAALELRDADGAAVAVLVESLSRREDASLASATLVFLARDVPALGYRTYRAVPADAFPADAAWQPRHGSGIENEAFALEVDPGRGGAIVRLTEKRSGKELLRPGEVGNELRCYGEYPMHPHFGEGPWHLTPDGTRTSTLDGPAEVAVETSALGSRIRVRSPFRECHRTQEIVLWNGLDRVGFATHLDDYSGQDLLFRVRFGAAVEGGMPISEVGNAVIGRGFGFPNADVGEARFTLDDPAYDWFGLGATARVDLLDGPGAAPHASRAIGVAELVVIDEHEDDDAVRALVVALVRQGVTATVGRDVGHRYGTLDVDSNLPDVRISIGGPAENRFTAAVVEDAGKAYRAELERQLSERGWARVWVPAEKPLAETWRPNVDLRGVRQLPVLIVAAKDATTRREALAALASDLEDAVIEVAQPSALDGNTGRVEDYTVAVLNRGLPGFNVEPDGSLYLSLMRSCSGWPSGIWIDPPRRTVPDGSNFQFQHWSHTFEYALVAAPGDWRAAGIVRSGHDYDQPLMARVFEAHPGQSPASASLAEVRPASAVLTVLKPAGDPLACLAAPEVDPAAGITFRVYESSGRPTTAAIRFFRPLHDAFETDLLEESRRAADVEGGEIRLELEPFGINTVTARPEGGALRADGDGRRAATEPELGPRGELAQPVFSDYWLHNKGPAPMGYQPVAVQIRPARLSGPGPFRVPITVASERSDGPIAGSVGVHLPPGWEAAPAERSYRLAPGAHLAFETVVSAPAGAAPGRYFVAARISEESGQVYEDVVTIDLSGAGEAEGSVDLDERSPSLSLAVERAMRRTDPQVWRREGTPEAELGGELEAELTSSGIRVEAGERGELRVLLRNRAASEIRGEAQLISPHETWPLTTPWTQGFTVAAGGEASVAFEIRPPAGFRGGGYWALVKIMYFGRLLYTEAVKLELPARLAAGEALTAARRATG
jgi:alpha-mannosidase